MSDTNINVSDKNETNSNSSSTSNLNPAGCWVTHKRLEAWARVAKERALNCTSPIVFRNGLSKLNAAGSRNSEEFNFSKESHNIQPPQQIGGQCMTAEFMKSSLETIHQNQSSPSLQHQSKSYPGGSQARLTRTPSISSQSSFDSSVSRQHRGSSPQIRTYGPDGRSSAPLTETKEIGSRSPSPHRTASLDIRSSSHPPAMPYSFGEMRTSSPSQSSLVSLTNSSICSSTSTATPGSPRGSASYGRCLSPLLIPAPGKNEMTSGQMPPASPLGTLQPDLYQKKDGPLFLGNHSRGGLSFGRLHLRLKYDFDRSDFSVHLIEAHDLASGEQGGFSDPYVKVTLMPAVDNRKRQTSIIRNNPNPFFDQEFKFPVSHDQLQEKTLILQVFDYDRFSRNDVIGEVRIAMNEFDVSSSVEVWGEITKNKKPPEEIQEILLSLSYLPSAERLTVVVLKARNLFLPGEKDTIDPYVKVNLIVSGKKVKKRKTAPRKASTNPVWNEALSFGLSSANLNQATLEICVVDSAEFIGHSPLIGVCIIGPREDGNEKNHWFDMIQSPRKAVASWHVLR